MFPLRGFRPPVFRFAATDIPSSSAPLMFQPAGFDATIVGTLDKHLGWDEFGYDDILTAMNAPQAEEVGPPQFTRAPPVGTQQTQPVDGATPVAGGATPAAAGPSLAGGGTPADGGTPDAAGSSQAAMATPSPDQLGPRVVRPLEP